MSQRQIFKSKAQARASYKLQLSDSKSSFAAWSDDLWNNLTPILKNYKVIGSYEPLPLEPRLPINPDFQYPKIKDSFVTYEQDPEVLLIPGLAFSVHPQFYRLGYGGGYFDRYTSEHPDAYKIGIAFECSVIAEVNWPVDSWDVGLDEIVTESRRIKL